MKTTLSGEALSPILENLRKANAAFAARYPGESLRRQPVHTVYGGAQIFRYDTAPRLGRNATSRDFSCAVASRLRKFL